MRDFIGECNQFKVDRIFRSLFLPLGDLIYIAVAVLTRDFNAVTN